MRILTIATRGSKLALWQAEHVARRLAALCSCEARFLIVKTRGDAMLDLPLAKVGGKGLFVKEIQEALLDGRADLAVHSMKDMPADSPPGLALGAILERGAPEDMLLSLDWPSLDSLPPGASVGTSSLRRQAQILAARPDLAVEPLRGNVDTRLEKLRQGRHQAIVLAAAGVERLGLTAPHMRPLPASNFLPAAGQGALGLEFSQARTDIQDLLARLDHAQTRLCILAERAFAAGMGGSCQVPVAAHAALSGSGLILEGLIARPDGTRVIRRSITGPSTQGEELGQTLARAIRLDGGNAILQSLSIS